MPESKPNSVHQATTSHHNVSSRPPGRSSSWFVSPILLSLLAPVLAAILVYQLDSFDPAPLPLHELAHTPLKALLKNDRMLQGSEFLGAGQLPGPEDIAYDSKSGIIYTGCVDGWIKRVRANDSAVENWVNTGGRTLGLVLGHNEEVILADAYKGLLKVSSDGVIEVLTNEADGMEFKLTDGVDITSDGTIYFTDASYKYYLHEFMLDILEGKPYGRLLSYHPSTNKTRVLASNLYFPNGVAVSPQEDCVVFCETNMRRCSKYYIQGSKKGSIEKFIDHLPGFPDNIHYDGNGHYWIAIASEFTSAWDIAYRYPVIRKVMAMIVKYIGPVRTEKNGGVFVVDLEGKPIAHYFDPGLMLISSGVKIGNHLYCGSIIYPHIIRLDLSRHPAHATT